MRKLLLATTAVVATAFIAPAAMAQTAVAAPLPSSLAGTSNLAVRLGGFFEFRAFNVNDDADRNAVVGARRHGRQRVDFQNEIELNVFVDGKAANGLAYGAVIEFQMDGIQGSTSTGVDLDEAYAFLTHPVLGTVRFGMEDSAASILQVRAPNIPGTSVSDFADEAFVGRQSILVGINDGSDATKITYLSPQFFGFDFGLSYAPNGGESEGQQSAGVNDRNRSGIRNEISGGLRYRGTFGPVGVSLGLVGMQADSAARYAGPATLRSRSNAYSAGAQVTAFGFTVGGEYTWGDYGIGAPGRVAQSRGQDATQQFVVGATYNVPGLDVAIGGYYGQTNFDTNGVGAKFRQEAYGFGLSYALAPGLTTFASYAHIRETNAASDQNLAAFGGQTTRNAEAYLTGFRLAF